MGYHSQTMCLGSNALVCQPCALRSFSAGLRGLLATSGVDRSNKAATMNDFETPCCSDACPSVWGMRRAVQALWPWSSVFAKGFHLDGEFGS